MLRVKTQEERQTQRLTWMSDQTRETETETETDTHRLIDMEREGWEEGKHWKERKRQERKENGEFFMCLNL